MKPNYLNNSCVPAAVISWLNVYKDVVRSHSSLQKNQTSIECPLSVTNIGTIFWSNTFEDALKIKQLIKTITKFPNMIGYHQPDLSTNRTVYASCL